MEARDYRRIKLSVDDLDSSNLAWGWLHDTKIVLLDPEYVEHASALRRSFYEYIRYEENMTRYYIATKTFYAWLSAQEEVMATRYLGIKSYRGALVIGSVRHKDTLYMAERRDEAVRREEARLDAMANANGGFWRWQATLPTASETDSAKAIELYQNYRKWAAINMPPLEVITLKTWGLLLTEEVGLVKHRTGAGFLYYGIKLPE